MEVMEGEKAKSPAVGKNISTSTAIIIAGALIALAVLATNGGPRKDVSPTGVDPKINIAKTLRPVTDKDHVFGDLKKAQVILVEFSDLQCPFCQRFHPTLKQVVEDFGDRVAWAYRHLPLESIHPYAFRGAEASECAASLGGKDAFWRYIDEIFVSSFDTANIDAVLLKAATTIGIAEEPFLSCLAGGNFKDKIRADMAEAEAIGATGTPFTVVLAKSGKYELLLGAESLDSVKAKINSLLK